MIIQKSLNAWMAGDSFIRQTWILGLEGSVTKNPTDLDAHLENIYQDFQETNGIIVQLLQFKGIESHAWLLTDIQKSAKGFELEIVDSNDPQLPVRLTIHLDAFEMNPAAGEPFLFPGNEKHYSQHISAYYPSFTAYTHFRPELKKLQKAVAEYCD
jgi:hypothetical protein